MLQDTLAAWEALREYSKQMEGQEGDTRLTITVEPLHDHTRAHTFYTKPANLLHLQTRRVYEACSSNDSFSIPSG